MAMCAAAVGRQVLGIEFKQGLVGAGRSAVGGLGAWEIVARIRGLVESNGNAAGLAEQLGLKECDVVVALECYGLYPEEIDVWIDVNEHEAMVGQCGLG
ncbi:MAG: hypothetical protein LBG11_11960 [Bifidobacteriaceae bacterium]|nr:hypothetical protein [Bifidobacteriaceae bacterium]